MAKQVLNNSETGLLIRTKINENFTELYTDKLDKSGDTLSGDLDFDNHDITNIKAVAFKDGQEMTWNPNKLTVDIPTGLGPILQAGQEMYIIVRNDTGVQIENGKAVYISGITSGYQNITLAKADVHTNFGNGVLISTMTIPNNSVGVVTGLGQVTMDTSVLSLGQPVYLSATNAGELTNTAPKFPNYELFLGGTVVVDATNGILNVNSNKNKENTFTNFYNGIIRESLDFRITSDGTTITGTLSASDGADNLTMICSSGFTLLDVSTPPTIALTVGTDTNPQTNYIYIPCDTKVLTKSTSGFPTTEHIKIANVAVTSALRTKKEGVLRNQNINNEVASTTSFIGHSAHLGEKLRQFDAQWKSGIEGSSDITANVVTLQSTAGIVYQLHEQAFPLKDTRQYTIDALSVGSKTFTISDDGDLSSRFLDGALLKVNGSTGNDKLYTIVSSSYSSPDFVITVSDTIDDATVDGTIGDDVSVVNHSSTPFLNVSDLTDITLDASGNSLNNTSFSFVVWGVANKTGEVSHLMLNLPSDTYSKTAPEDAVSDALNYNVYTIPAQFKGVGFLIARYTYVNNGGTWTLYATEDLRGRVPNTSAGGGAGGTGVTSFTGLTDTNSAYTSQAGKVPIVNPGETALEFDYIEESFMVAVSDEISNLVEGTSKITFRMPYAFELSDIRANVNTAPTGSTIIIDVNENAVTILSTKLTIDATEKTSTTAATPLVISDTSLADDSEITVDIDQVGSTLTGVGLKLTFIGKRV